MQINQMNIRDFHILSDAQTGFKPIDACCQFLYKNYQISVSTAGLSQGACQTPVCIFDGIDHQDIFKDCFDTIEQAIDYINHISYLQALDPDVLKQLQKSINT